jgi:HEAT repeat protein
MSVKTSVVSGHFFSCGQRGLLLFALACTLCGYGLAQDASAKTQDTSAKPDAAAKKTQDAPTKANAAAVGDVDQPAPALPPATTAEARSRAAWTLLSDAATDSKHSQTRIQALAALALLRSPRSEKMIAAAMGDSDLDVRTAAALAAGETRDRNLTTSLRNLLDDKEPQVAFTAAMTLFKMGDKSGEDILMSVVEGESSAGANMVNSTKHKINKDLHNPGMLARMGAMQGASMLLGPFGYGLTAIDFVHQSGGDLARVSAIEQISQERIEPIHKALIAALGDKDLAVRAAAAKGLMAYHDQATSMAVYALLADGKQPVRLTAAAVYLRTTGTPGPPLGVSALAKPTR